ncbi:pilus assembly protein TadG-related protein [Streptomyces sp. NPDC001553]|uniref:pilus assembly protein TadG-related protein n=1 Tax=Streptomyces sp. NPDC001553 TaxID=3154385 RepID=UPI0033220F18
MTSGRRLDDRGQAFPVYVVAVVGLLFAALAFFVVGMAGATRSDAQGAADAAALAAAQEARDKVFVDRDLLVLKPADWEALLRGDRLDGSSACAKAVEFAALNAATAECEAALPEFTVAVTTDGTVGNSVIPGTEAMHGEATAKAVIEPRCTLGAGPVTTPSPTAPPSDGGAETPPATVALTCKGGVSVELDPSSPGSLLQLARKLFSVRLVN